MLSVKAKSRHLHPIWVIPLCPKVSLVFNTHPYFGFTLSIALQSHLKKVSISNVSFSNFHFH